jgi:hypothetical protein
MVTSLKVQPKHALWATKQMEAIALLDPSKVHGAAQNLQ